MFGFSQAMPTRTPPFNYPFFPRSASPPRRRIFASNEHSPPRSPAMAMPSSAESLALKICSSFLLFRRPCGFTPSPISCITLRPPPLIVNRSSFFLFSVVGTSLPPPFLVHTHLLSLHFFPTSCCFDWCQTLLQRRRLPPTPLPPEPRILPSADGELQWITLHWP